jgi:hypothetical protein
MLLTDSRVDPSARDNYAIRSASRNGHTDVAKVLLADARVDPSAMDVSPIVPFVSRFISLPKDGSNIAELCPSGT